MSREARPSYEFGLFRLDLSEHVLLRDGCPVPLTPKVFDVLRVLVQNGGHLVEKDTLMKEVWPDAFVEEGAFNRSVSVLGKALGESPSGPKYIETAPKAVIALWRLSQRVPPIVPEPSSSRKPALLSMHRSRRIHFPFTVHPRRRSPGPA